MSTVCAGTISTDEPRRNPANTSSSTSGGRGAVAEYKSTGSAPMAIATSMRVLDSPLRRQCSAPPLCSCQCMPSVCESKTCKRYMPMFRLPLAGSWVNTNGMVMYGPPSSGQQVGMGRPSSVGAAVSTMSCTGPARTVRGPMRPMCTISPRVRSLPQMPAGGGLMARSSRCSRRVSNSDQSSMPRAHAIRCWVPSRLIASGTSEPFTFSNSSAGPSAFITRSAISVISRCGSTSTWIRRSCPCFSTWSIKARRS